MVADIWTDERISEHVRLARVKRRHASRKRLTRIRRAKACCSHAHADWLALVAGRGRACVACGRIGPVEKDHIVPIYAGGCDGLHNLQPLCARCNRSKGPDQYDYASGKQASLCARAAEAVSGGWSAVYV